MTNLHPSSPPPPVKVVLQRIVLLPMAVAFVMVLALIISQYLQRVADGRAAALATAQALALAVDHQILHLQSGLTVLASAASLARGDYSQFHERAATLHDELGVTHIGVLDPAGRQLVNTSLPLGAALPNPGRSAPALPVILTGKPMAKVISAPIDGRPLVIVSVPVRVEGETRYALTASIQLTRFGAMFSAQRLPASWIGAVVDGHAIIAARSHDAGKFVGQPAAPALRRALSTGESGIFDGRTLDGFDVSTAFSKSPSFGWAVAIGIPKAELTRELTGSLLALTAGTMLTLGLMTGLAWRQGQRAAGSLASLVDAAEQLGKGQPVELPAMRVQEAERLATALRQSGRELAARHADLAGNEARWSAVLDSATDGILSVDESHRIVIYNRAAERIFGWTASEMLGQPVDPLLPKALDRADDALSTDNPGGALTVRGLRKSGELFPVEASVSEVQTSEGRLRTIIVRDVSELHRARETMATLSRQAAAAREQEKSRIARELHDELAQTLSTLKLEARSLAARLPGDAEARAKLDEMVAMLDDGVAATRRIAADLRPMILDDLGLDAAVRWLADNFTRRTGVQCILDIPDAHDIKEPWATAVFRIVQESLRNVGKHAGATVARIGVNRTGDLLEVGIDDNGTGFAGGQPRPAEALGLVGLRERTQLLRGTLQVDSAPGRGTRVLATLPLNPVDPDEIDMI